MFHLQEILVIEKKGIDPYRATFYFMSIALKIGISGPKSLVVVHKFEQATSTYHK